MIAQVSAIGIHRENANRAADNTLAVTEEDCVPAQRGNSGGLKSRRAGSHHEHGLRTLRRHEVHLRFARRGCVDSARHRDAMRPDVVTFRQSETHPDLAGATLERLPGQIGVSDERSDHADHVGGAVGENPFCNRQVRDAAGDDDRACDFALHGSSHWDVEPGFLVPGTDVCGLEPVAKTGVAAAAHADICHVVGKQRADLRELVDGEAVVVAVAVETDSDPDREVRADELARFGDDRQDKPHAVFAAATPLVGAVVEVWGEELMDEIAVRAMDFRGIEFRLP